MNKEDMEHSSPQGDPQGDKTPTTMHIHGIYRDPTNDYGAKYTS